MAKKTCIHFDPVKPGCEIHNWRMKELDYVINELTPNNEHWVDPRYAGKTLSDIRKEIAERYQATVGQKMQAKAAPIREAAVVIKPDTTMADLQLLAKQLEKEFGIKCIQIHIHRDEGFNKTNPDPSKLNLQKLLKISLPLGRLSASLSSPRMLRMHSTRKSTNS